MTCIFLTFFSFVLQRNKNAAQREKKTKKNVGAFYGDVDIDALKEFTV